MMVKVLLCMVKLAPRVVVVQLYYRLLCEVMWRLLNILSMLCYLFLCDVKTPPLKVLTELRDLFLRNVVGPFVLMILMVACSNARYPGTEPKKT